MAEEELTFQVKGKGGLITPDYPRADAMSYKLTLPPDYPYGIGVFDLHIF